MFSFFKSKAPKPVKVYPQEMYYKPIFSFNSPLEKLIKCGIDLTISKCKRAHFDWINEVNIFTCSIFTAQLEYKLRDLFNAYNERATDGSGFDDVNENVRLIIRAYHLDVVKVYPQLKEY